MGIVVELHEGAGGVVTRLPDPSGGTFDAAGDFDRIVEMAAHGRADAPLPVLSSIDPHDTSSMPSGAMAPLLADISRVIPVARAGSETRGLLRLRALAETCSRLPASSLVWVGD